MVRAADGAVLASTATDSTGVFSLTFTNSAGPGIYLRVLSLTANSSVHVAVTDTAGNLYAAAGASFNERTAIPTTVSLTAPVVTAGNEAIGGAFHIMDRFIDGSEFVRTLSGQVPPLVTARWEIGTGGTFYDSDLDQISVAGGSGLQTGDHDEYDDSVLLHEYGHHIANHFSRDDSPGGVHFLSDNTEDIRLAWSEGWATFFAGAVLDSPNYVDTVGGDPPSNSASAFDLETRAAGSPLTYTTNEGAVATVLWDIFDQSTTEAFDGIGGQMAGIWDVVANALPAASTVSMEDFWDGWFTRGHGFATEMQSVTDDRQMGFSQDPSGTNDTAVCITPLALNTSLNETLYSATATDVDYVCVNLTQGTSYTIETINLSNGADTFLQILNDQMTMIASNDNGTDTANYSQCQTPGVPCPPNDGTSLASRVTLTPSASGTYFVKITRSANAPPSAGTYGSYTLRLTSP
ncbi:MAG: pre-peptidase C-terminal domain-containing protein [Nitrospirae bacterium]|nr:pre-peptidase C-terminal domain-containing protein [Nitrospirota bacterium]